MRARVLVIAGSDSGGGAGIAADLRTLTAFGVYGASAVTAVTVQDTACVHEVFPLPPSLVAHQVRVALIDPGADAIKTGMLVNAATIEAVADALCEVPALPLVVDPVLQAGSGTVLLDPEAISVFVRLLLPRASLITPNLAEAEALAGIAVANEQGIVRAAEAILGLGAQAVLVKGGHLDGEEAVDLLGTGTGFVRFASPRLHAHRIHGSGCTLASAIAAELAQGMPLVAAIRCARAYVAAALLAAPSFGAGAKLLDHTVLPPRGGRW